jgi:hypothetical protein
MNEWLNERERRGEWFADGHSVSVPGTLTEMTPYGQLLGFVQFTFPKGTNFKLRNRWITFNAPVHQWSALAFFVLFVFACT